MVSCPRFSPLINPASAPCSTAMGPRGQIEHQEFLQLRKLSPSMPQLDVEPTSLRQYLVLPSAADRLQVDGSSFRGKLDERSKEIFPVRRILPTASLCEMVDVGQLPLIDCNLGFGLGENKILETPPALLELLTHCGIPRVVVASLPLPVEVKPPVLHLNHPVLGAVQDLKTAGDSSGKYKRKGGQGERGGTPKSLDLRWHRCSVRNIRPIGPQ